MARSGSTKIRWRKGIAITVDHTRRQKTAPLVLFRFNENAAGNCNNSLGLGESFLVSFLLYRRLSSLRSRHSVNTAALSPHTVADGPISHILIFQIYHVQSGYFNTTQCPLKDCMLICAGDNPP